jgi:protein tyrosine/serine phosphatase
MKLYADAWSGWEVPKQEQIDAALECMLHVPGPVFVHCEHGSDRTGTLCACWRIKFDGWSAVKAIEESLFGLGTHGLHEGWLEAAVWEFSRRVSGSSGIQ